MKHGKRISLLFCLGILLYGLTWRISHPRVPDPIYEGKPLSFWMRDFGGLFGGDYQKRRQAYAAVRAADTNAIPVLLQMMKAKDYPFKARVYELLSKQKWIEFRPAWSSKLHHNAADAFSLLGPKAESAVPRLVEIHEENKAARRYIDFCLGDIGPKAMAAITILIRDTSDNDPYLRSVAVVALRQIEAPSELVVPVLAKLLDDPLVCDTAAKELCYYGHSAKSAVPALIKAATTSTNSELRVNAAATLAVIEPAWASDADKTQK